MLHRLRRSKSLPPGPKGHWVIGNFLDIPKTVDVKLLALWKDTYGDLVYLNVAGYSILILNSRRSINDLLEKRGRNYSHRPPFVMAGELVGLNRSMALINYGEEYRRLRKTTQHALNADASRKYCSIQRRIVAAYLGSLVNKPGEFMKELRLTAARLILAVVYGLPVETSDSEYITNAEAAMALINKVAIPGVYLVDAIPALKYLPSWFPCAPFIQEAKSGREQVKTFVTKPFEYVKSQMALGCARPSFVENLLSDKEFLQSEFGGEADESIKWAAGTMYGAGIESSYATISIFFMLMALHPKIQQRAQLEIDAVIGQNQVVDVQDQDRLPYVRAVIQELLRWHVVLPLGIAHCSIEDDTYLGYHIPAGTVMVPNVWALSQYQDNIESPEIFNPDRFLGSNRPTNPEDYIFGFGRRVCPGKYLAGNSVFLLAANILAFFDVSLPPKESLEGLVSPENVSFLPYLVSCPEKFDCIIDPRSRSSREYLLEELTVVVD